MSFLKGRRNGKEIVLAGSDKKKEPNETVVVKYGQGMQEVLQANRNGSDTKGDASISSNSYFAGAIRWSVLFDDREEKYYISSHWEYPVPQARQIEWFYATDKEAALRRGTHYVDVHRQKRRNEKDEKG